MWVIEDMVEIMCPIKLSIQRRFLALIMVDAIVIIFDKATRNTELTFNLVTAKCFDSFCAEMLAFLFAIIYYSISKYQSRNKVVRPFNRKIIQSLYYYT